MATVTILGCGYLGQRLARWHQQRGDQVLALVATKASAEQLNAQGIEAKVLDLDQEAVDTVLAANVDGLYYLVPPSSKGTEDERVARLLQGWGSERSACRVLYLSTTGVYGDCGGVWVDESRPVNPPSDRAKRRWSAEQQWRQWQQQGGGELVVLRVAGIYGPGRLPLARLRKGLPMLGADEAPYSNRIHVDDLTQVCVAAMTQAADGALYNVSDGHPTTMRDYFDRVADLAGLPRPPLVTRAEAYQSLSPEMLGYLGQSRRLRIDRLIEELDVSMRYPDLASGLAACLPIDE